VLAGGFGDVVDAADVGVGYLAGYSDFVQEAVQAGLVLFEFGGEELEGDRLAELEVVGSIDLAHAAAAQ
jgi:hypothetical protein